MTERYKRQEMIKGWNQGNLSNGQVLVLGAGTTGNEVIKNLALLGVGHITIVDKDTIEEVNLSRCVLFRTADIRKPKAETAAVRAMELNPLITANGWDIDIVYDLGCLEYTRFNCVILTVDNLKARMWANRYCWQNKVPLINTGIEGWTGNVFTMFPNSTSCIECGWKTSEYRRLAEEHSCSKIGLLFDERKIPMVITSAAIVGSIAVQEMVKILQQASETPSANRNYWWFDGETGAFLSWEQPEKDDCPHHEYPRLEAINTFPSISVLEKVDTIRERLKNTLNCEIVEIKHDKEIVYSVSCRHCSYNQTIQPVFLDRYIRFPCPSCGFLETVPDDFGNDIRDGFTFSQLGIPKNHLLRVFYDKGETVETTLAVTKG